MVQGDAPAPASDNSTPQDDQASSQSGTSEGAPPGAQGSTPSTSQNSNMDTSQPPNTSAPSSNGQSSTSGQATHRPRESSTVVNFMPQNTAHRDPLLPCQSFHFASLLPSLGQTAPAGTQTENPGGQTGQIPTTGVIS